MSLPKETLDKALERLRENARARYGAGKDRVREKYETEAKEIVDKYMMIAKRFSGMLRE